MQNRFIQNEGRENMTASTHLVHSGTQKRLRDHLSWSNKSEIHRKLHRYLNDIHIITAQDH